MKTSEYLIESKALIEAGWTKGSLARDEDDITDSVVSSTACKFCAMGALKRVYYIHYQDYQREFEEYVLEKILSDAATTLVEVIDTQGFGTVTAKIIRWNDRLTQTKEKVLTGFDRAIALAKADEDQ